MLVAVSMPTTARGAQERVESRAEKTSLEEWARSISGRKSYGLYLLGSKVGWIIDEREVTSEDGELVFRHRNRTFMDAEFVGMRSTSDSVETILYALEGEGEIVGVHVRAEEDGLHTLLVGERQMDEQQESVLSLISSAEGRVSNREVPVPRMTLAHQRDLAEWLAGSPAAGESFVQWATNWEAVDVNESTTLAYVGRRTLQWGGLPLEVHDVRAEFRGLRGKGELGADGVPLRGSMGGAGEWRLEPERTVKDLDASADMLVAAGVPVDRLLGPPEQVEELVLRLHGLGDFPLPTSGRQIKRVDEEGQVLVHLRRDAPAGAGPLDDEQRERLLGPTPRIQCRDARIVELAQGLTDPEAPAVENARRLAGWVFDNMEQSMAAGAPTALDVLERRAGDCTELTLIFVALARAAGLPAREVGGVMHVPVSPPIFAWHAWAEIHDGTDWISVDPTWNELPVDATHLKLSTQWDDVAWLSLLGGLRLEVVEVRPAGDVR